MNCTVQLWARIALVSIVTGYGLDGPEIESRLGARFSAPVQTGSGAHPASYTMGSLSAGTRVHFYFYFVVHCLLIMHDSIICCCCYYYYCYISAVIIELLSWRPPPLQFVVDHPFLFIIWQKRLNTTLFMGRFLGPQ